MSDPTRLLGEGSEFERSLLGAWDSRQPDEAARLRTLATLGVVAVSAGAGTAAAAGSSIAPKAMVLSSALLKWIGIGVGISATVAVAGYATYARIAVPPEATRVLVERAGPLAPPTPTEAPAPPIRAKEQNPADDLTVESLPVTPPRTTSQRPSVPAPAAAATLDEEVYAIDQARRALYAGNATSALELVDAYDAKYPGGALAQESTEIRIEALFRTGKRPLATRLATRFLAAHPESPYAREIRALMAAPPTP